MGSHAISWRTLLPTPLTWGGFRQAAWPSRKRAHSRPAPQIFGFDHNLAREAHAQWLGLGRLGPDDICRVRSRVGMAMTDEDALDFAIVVYREDDCWDAEL